MVRLESCLEENIRMEFLFLTVWIQVPYSIHDLQIDFFSILWIIRFDDTAYSTKVLIFIKSNLSFVPLLFVLFIL